MNSNTTNAAKDFQITIERRDDVAGKVRYGYWTPGILRPGTRNRTIRTWASKSAAREAARREYPTRRIVG